MPDILLCCVLLYVGYRKLFQRFNPTSVNGSPIWILGCCIRRWPYCMHWQLTCISWDVWQGFYLWINSRIESSEKNYLSVWRRAAELGLHVPWLWLSTQHFNMYGISWTHPVSELLFEFNTSLLLFTWDFQSAQMKMGGGGLGRRNNKWEQARRREIKTEGKRDDKHACVYVATVRWPWEWQLWQQNKFECWSRLINNFVNRSTWPSLQCNPVSWRADADYSLTFPSNE